MKNGYLAKQSIVIYASSSKVWDALINPKLIKQYFFGTQATSDWKTGSSITYRGVWKGQVFEDHGKVLQVEPEKILRTTFLSGALDDIPENKKVITYELSAEGHGVKVTVSQDNNATSEATELANENWKLVLEQLKKLLEKSER